MLFLQACRVYIFCSVGFYLKIPAIYHLLPCFPVPMIKPWPTVWNPVLRSPVQAHLLQMDKAWRWGLNLTSPEDDNAGENEESNLSCVCEHLILGGVVSWHLSESSQPLGVKWPSLWTLWALLTKVQTLVVGAGWERWPGSLSVRRLSVAAPALAAVCAVGLSEWLHSLSGLFAEGEGVAFKNIFLTWNKSRRRGETIKLWHPV